MNILNITPFTENSASFYYNKCRSFTRIESPYYLINDIAMFMFFMEDRIRRPVLQLNTIPCNKERIIIEGTPYVVLQTIKFQLKKYNALICRNIGSMQLEEKYILQLHELTSLWQEFIVQFARDHQKKYEPMTEKEIIEKLKNALIIDISSNNSNDDCYATISLMR